MNASCKALLAILLLTGCNSEETLLVNNDALPAEKGSLSFVLPLGKKGPVTYASVAGKDAEYELENLFIYWFKDIGGGNYELFKTFSYGVGADNITLSNTALTSHASSTVATVMVGDETAASRFYIVANVNGTGIAAHALTNLAAGASETALQEAFANALAVDTNGNLELIQTPLPMSVIDDGSTPGGFVTVASPAAGGTISGVHLKRRVARFDIINTESYSNFEVTRVIVNRAQRAGWLHDVAFADTDPYFDEGVTIIDASLTANGPAGIALGDNDHDGLDDAFAPGAPTEKDSTFLNESVFYLWPTVLKQNDGVDPTDGTEIVIEGKYYGSVIRLYKLKLSKDQTVEANKVYRIKIARHAETQLKFELIVDDWDDEFDYPTANAGSSVNWASATFAAPGVTASTGLPANYEYASSSSAPVDVTIVTTGTNLTTSGHVTTVRILPKAGAYYLASDLADTQAATIVSNTVLTYGAYYTTTHIISMPPTDAPIETMLVITNAANEYDSQKITLKSNNYAKTGFKPVKKGNLLWAPVNVGATVLDSTGSSFTSANGGYHFQWGRNLGWDPNYTLQSTDKQAGPITPAQLASYADKFISMSSNADWLNPSDDDAWGGESLDPAKMQGPCPPGWRVPTSAELNTLFSGTNAWKGNNKVLTCDDGKVYLQAAGYHNYDTALGQVGSRGYYWSATKTSGTPGNSAFLRFQNGGGSQGIQQDGRVIAYPIRAVRDIP
jgi:hypothetical protein